MNIAWTSGPHPMEEIETTLAQIGATLKSAGWLSEFESSGHLVKNIEWTEAGRKRAAYLKQIQKEFVLTRDQMFRAVYHDEFGPDIPEQFRITWEEIKSKMGNLKPYQRETLLTFCLNFCPL